MPLYEFECPKCNRIMEQLLSRAEADKPVKCPVCRNYMKRMFSSPNMGSSSPERFAQPSPKAPDHVKERHRKEVISMNKESEKQYKKMKKKLQQGT